MKIDRHDATAAFATTLLLGVASTAGCTSSYSVEVPAVVPVTAAPVTDVQALTQAVNWEKIPVAAMTEGF